MKLILTHDNADFDAVASLLAAHKLEPEAIPVLPRRINRNVEHFLNLYGSGLPFVHPKDLKKGITVEQTKDVFRIARKHGIDRCAYIMIGCPSEEKADIEMTMRLVKDIRPEHLHCSICAPMPRTYLYQKLLNEGLITHDYWLEFARNPDPSFRTPFFSQFFSSDELRNMQNSIQRQFYMDPRIILREIRKTRDIKQFLAKAMMAFRVIFR